MLARLTDLDGLVSASSIPVLRVRSWIDIHEGQGNLLPWLCPMSWNIFAVVVSWSDPLMRRVINGCFPDHIAGNFFMHRGYGRAIGIKKAVLVTLLGKMGRKMSTFSTAPEMGSVSLLLYQPIHLLKRESKSCHLVSLLGWER